MNTPKPCNRRRVFLRIQNYATVSSLLSSSLTNRLSKDWRKRLRRGAVNTVGGVLIGLGALGVTACPNPAGPSNGTEQEEENEYISSELNHDLNYDFGSETNPTDAYGTTLGSIYDVPDSDGLEAYFDDADFDTNFSDAIDDMYNKHGTIENGKLRVFPHVSSDTYLDFTVDVEGGYDSIEWYENGTKIGDGENFQYNVDFFDETRELEARVYLNGEEKDRHSIDVEALSNVQPGYPMAFGGNLDEENRELNIPQGSTAYHKVVRSDLHDRPLTLNKNWDHEGEYEFSSDEPSQYELLDDLFFTVTPSNKYWSVEGDATDFGDTGGLGPVDYRVHYDNEYETDDEEIEMRIVD